jgi:hypothetical protein
VRVQLATTHPQSCVWAPDEDIVGSCLALLCEIGWYGVEPDHGIRLKRATMAFKGFMKAHGVSSSCPPFTTTNCHIDKNSPASFEIAKATHIKHALLFCAYEMQPASCSIATNQEVACCATCVWALAAWIQLLDMRINEMATHALTTQCRCFEQRIV